MKHMRKALSLLLVLAMVVCFAVPAFAADTDNATVTVYVTTGMFTKGGIGADGNKVDQAYIGGNPEDYLISGYEAFPVDGLSMNDTLTEFRKNYDAPGTLSSDVNVLDAIIFSLSMNGFTCSGGWDTYNVPNGGYIHDVYPNYEGTVTVSEEKIGDTTYAKYSGMGWNIAFTQDGEYVVPEYYGNNYVIQDGMEIVFDYSYYELYYPVTVSN